MISSESEAMSTSVATSTANNQTVNMDDNNNIRPSKVLGRKSSIVVAFLFQIHIITTLSQVKAEASHKISTLKENLPDDSLRDPIIWDSSSLYSPNTSSGPLISRHKRSTPSQNQLPRSQQQVVDACQSKMEVLTPYYATNSKGKLRTIVNSELMQQAIQVETCISSRDIEPELRKELKKPSSNHETNQLRTTFHSIRSPPSASSQGSNQSAGKCNSQPDCGCEQKYKWHRLLVFEQLDHRTGTSKGLFMDWFLFPSNCVCRCRISPMHSSTKHFMKTIIHRKS